MQTVKISNFSFFFLLCSTHKYLDSPGKTEAAVHLLSLQCGRSSTAQQLRVQFYSCFSCCHKHCQCKWKRLTFTRQCLHELCTQVSNYSLQNVFKSLLISVNVSSSCLYRAELPHGTGAKLRAQFMALGIQHLSSQHGQDILFADILCII